VNGISASHVIVEPGGTGVVAHVGLHALGCFADRLGLGDSLSARIPVAGERLPIHDRGKVLVHTALMLAAGGESCADIEHLRLQSDLFGSVPSDSTVFRTFHQLDATTRAGIAEAMAEMRAKVWSRSSVANGSSPVILDIDASLVEIHTDGKEEAAPTYKGGFGFHPMLCFADATGEALASMVRPGNAGAKTVTDHLNVLDAAIGQRPAPIAVGHRFGDDVELATRAARHSEFAGAVGIDVYFAEPHSPWLRPTTRTSTGCCGDTSARARTSGSTARATSTGSVTGSTPCPDGSTSGSQRSTAPVRASLR